MAFLKGQKFTEEHRNKLSKAKKGKPNIARIGKKHSEETKRKMSLAKAGYKPWNTGKEVFQWRGNKHWRWTGNTPLKTSIRHCFKYRQWRSDIFTRDDFTCQLCFKRGGYIEADHYPVKFIEIFIQKNITTLEQAESCEEFWNINNGRTLCKNCHNKTKGK